jgi:hypothetical protein
MQWYTICTFLLIKECTRCMDKSRSLQLASLLLPRLIWNPPLLNSFNHIDWNILQSPNWLKFTYMQPTVSTFLRKIVHTTLHWVLFQSFTYMQPDVSTFLKKMCILSCIEFFFNVTYHVYWLVKDTYYFFSVLFFSNVHNYAGIS